MNGALGSQNRIFFASFLTLIAAGMGFAIRNSILTDWAAQFGFTMLELGTITGGGLLGFGLVIIVASLFTDQLGYKTIMLLALLCHIASAVITLSAAPIYAAYGKDATYLCLYYGSLIFAIGNGLCEAVINPLVATLYPRQKTHYLNILHAGWPGGLILGAVLAKAFIGPEVLVTKLQWEIPMAFFLVPTAIYGFIVLTNKFPQSEAKAAGISYGEMLATLISPLLLFLFFLHACVGYVELGTDSWINKITEAIASAAGTEGQGLYLFIYASSVMFILRFFAGPIVEKINPLGLLFISACLGAIGLYLIGGSTGLAMIWVAVTIYSLGKTFLWPTMLGVVGECFPRGGAITMGFMGGIGMLSAGFLGAPGIGYKQDYYASNELNETAPATFERYAASTESGFMFFPKVRGLNGAKVGIITDKDGPGIDFQKYVTEMEKEKKLTEKTEKLNEWWISARPFAAEDIPKVVDAGTYGGRMALKWTAVVPVTMAVGYLLLILYFNATGGYKQEHLHAEAEAPSEY